MVRRSPAKKNRLTQPAEASQNTSGVSTHPGSVANAAGSAALAFGAGVVPHLDPASPDSHDSPSKPLRSPTKPVHSLQADNQSLETQLWDAQVELQRLTEQRRANEEEISKLRLDRAKLLKDHEIRAQALDDARLQNQELQQAVQRSREVSAADRRTRTAESAEDVESLHRQLEQLRAEAAHHKNVAQQAQAQAAAREAAADCAARITPHDDNSADESTSFDDTTIDATFDTLDAEAESDPRRARQSRLLRQGMLQLRRENQQLHRELANNAASTTAVDESFPEISFSGGGNALSEDVVHGTAAPEVLHLQAREFNHTLVPTAKYEQWARRGTEMDEPELRRAAKRLQLAVVSQEEIGHVRDLLEGKKPNFGQHSHVLQDLLATRDLSPTRTSEGDTLASLQRRVYQPTTAEVIRQAASLGLTVVPLQQFDELKTERAKLKQQLQHQPSAAEVAQLASRVGCKLIPNNPSPDELKGLLGEDIVFVERETFEANENPGPATLTRLAKHHNMVVMPESEARRLRQTAGSVLSSTPTSPTKDVAASGNTPSLDTLREQADTYGMVLLGAKQYEEMLTARSPAGAAFNSLPMSQRTQFFEEMIQTSKNSTSPARVRGSPLAQSPLGSIEDRMRRLGFVMVSQEEYNKLKASEMVYEPTKSDVMQAARQFGLATMPVEEFSELRASKWKSNSTHTSPVKPHNADVGASTAIGRLDDDSCVVPMSYLQALKKIAETPDRNDVEALAQLANVDLADMLSDDQIVNRACALGLPRCFTDAEVLARAKELGVPSDAEVAARASDLGFIPSKEIVTKARQLGLVDEPTNQQIVERAKQLGLIEPTKENVAAKAKEIGLEPPKNLVIARAKSFGLVEPPTEAVIVASAKSLGFIEPTRDAIAAKVESLGLEPPHDLIISRAKSFGLIEPPSDAQHVANAKALGYEKLSNDVIAARAKKLGLVEPPSQDFIVSKAKALGYERAPTDAQVLAKAKTLGLIEPNREYIMAEAKKNGLVVPPSNTIIISQAKQLGLVEPPKDQEILARAKKLGLVSKPSRTLIVAMAKKFGLIEPSQVEAVAKKLGWINVSEVPDRAQQLGFTKQTDQQVVAAAKKLGLVESPSNTVILARAKQLGLVEKPTESQVVAAARKLGLVEPPSNKTVIAKAKMLGLVEKAEVASGANTIAGAKELGLVEPLSRNALVSRARSLGLTEKPSDRQIVTRAKQLGLTEQMSDTAVLKRAEQLGYAKRLSASDIEQTARKEYGMVPALSDVEFVDKAKSLGYVPPLTRKQLVDKVKDLGFSRPLTEQEIKARAFQMGMVEPDGASDRTLSPQPPSSLPATLSSQPAQFTSSQPSESALAAMGRRNLSNGNTKIESPTKTSAKSSMKSSSSYKTNLSTSSSISPISPTKEQFTSPAGGALGTRTQSSGLPQNLRTAAANASPVKPQTVRQYEMVDGLNTRWVPRSGIIQSIESRRRHKQAVEQKEEDLGPLPLPSIVRQQKAGSSKTNSRTNTGLSRATFSTWSVATLAADDVETYMNQLLVGEDLFKYYRGFHDDGGRRHRRYFWYRPDTKELFWRREDNNIFSPAQAKRVVIVSVHEVFDRNGHIEPLYHRSIVVKGEERDIEFTCPTAGRHAVWLSCLRYSLRD